MRGRLVIGLIHSFLNLRITVNLITELRKMSNNVHFGHNNEITFLIISGTKLAGAHDIRNQFDNYSNI